MTTDRILRPAAVRSGRSSGAHRQPDRFLGGKYRSALIRPHPLAALTHARDDVLVAVPTVLDAAAHA